MDPRQKEEMEKKLASLQERWDTLGNRLQEAKERLLRAAGQGAELDNIVGGVLDWIGGLNKMLRNQKPIGVKTPLVDKQIEDHKVCARTWNLCVRSYIAFNVSVCTHSVRCVVRSEAVL